MVKLAKKEEKEVRSADNAVSEEFRDFKRENYEFENPEMPHKVERGW